MTRANVFRLYRLGFAALASVAIIVQGIDGVRRDDAGSANPFSWGNFFSYYTIQSNLFVIVLLVLLATSWSGRRTLPQTMMRGAIVSWIATTGVVYGLLLSGYSDGVQATLPWVDTVLHRLIPLVLVIDWVIDRPHNRLAFRRCLIWAVFPVAYGVYSLVRGPIVDWYPYPFLNPDKVGGYAGVAAYSVGIAIGFAAFVWAIVLLANRPWEDRTSRTS